jgi:hypothetical protein
MTEPDQTAFSNGAAKKDATNNPSRKCQKNIAAKLKSHTPTKRQLILRKLKSKKGATVADLIKLTHWQAHSIRGFLSSLRKQNYPLLTEQCKDKPNRYRIDNDKEAKA